MNPNPDIAPHFGRETQYTFTNGHTYPFTSREMLTVLRDRDVITGLLVAAAIAIWLRPFEAIGQLPTRLQIIYWGVLLPATLGTYIASLLVLGRYFRSVWTIWSHVITAIASACLTPELRGLLGLTGTNLTERVFAGGYTLIISVVVELVLVTYLGPRVTAFRSKGGATETEGQQEPPENVPTPSEEALPKSVILLGQHHRLDDLLLISAEEHYVRILTLHGSSLRRGRLSDIEAQLPDTLGLRVHRSHWVAASALRHLNRSREGWTLTLIDNSEIPVARARREAVKDWLETLGKAS